MSDFVGGSYDGSAAARTFFSSSLASGAYVLCLFIAPCNCDSDERVDCCWALVLVAVNVVLTVSEVDRLIAVELLEVGAEFPVAGSSRLSCGTL